MGSAGSTTLSQRRGLETNSGGSAAPQREQGCQRDPGMPLQPEGEAGNRGRKTCSEAAICYQKEIHTGLK